MELRMIESLKITVLISRISYFRLSIYFGKNTICPYGKGVIGGSVNKMKKVELKKDHKCKKCGSNKILWISSKDVVKKLCGKCGSIDFDLKN